MGLFNMFSKKDPAVELEKIHDLMVRGNKQKALQRMEDLRKKIDPLKMKITDPLFSEIQTAFRVEYLKKADALEQKSLFPQSAEWINMALDFCPDDAQRTELIERLDGFERMREEREDNEHVELDEQPEDKERFIEQPSIETDETHLFEALVQMFKPEIEEYYNALPNEFRQGLVRFHDGRTEGILELFDDLLEKTTSETSRAILILERSRLLLNDQNFNAARDGFETVWDFFGTQTLDLANTLSIPYLWSECCLYLQEPDKVADRCHELAFPEEGNPNLSLITGLALEQVDRIEDAVNLFHQAVQTFDLPDFGYHLGRVLNNAGEWKNAISILEKKVTPSCASGQCYAPPLHFPSMHLLTDIYLENKVGLDRVQELLIAGDRKLRGMLSKEHLIMWSKYYETTGDMVMSRKALRQAEKAQVKPDDNNQMPDVQASDSAIL